MSITVEKRSAIDHPWLNLDPIQIGRIPSGLGTPDAYFLVTKDSQPLFRVDYYGACQCYCFEEVLIWKDWLAIGIGEQVFLINIKNQKILKLHCEMYFGSFFPEEDYLLVVDGQGIHRIDREGEEIWHNYDLAIDGVLIDRIENEVIYGEGEWDPPGGWKPFQVDLQTGEIRKLVSSNEKIGKKSMKKYKIVSILIGVFIAILILIIIEYPSNQREGTMGLFARLFGKKSNLEKASQRSSEDLRKDPNFVQAFNEYGQEVFIEKKKWQSEILPGMIHDRWDKPDELYQLMVGTLQDGFYADIVEAANHLHQLEQGSVRASCVLSIVLMNLDRLDEAEEILTTCIKKQGEQGVLFTNLAKIHSARGEQDHALNTLWHALELDPNQDGAVDWWAAIHYEQSGDEGYIQALTKASSLDKSWRPQIWLAREALKRRDFLKAREYYEGILTELDPIPAKVMMQISGDLGRSGRMSDIVELFENRFNAEMHGLIGGNNLIQAYMELGDTKKAKRIVDSLYSLNRPDEREQLAFWEEQIDKRSGKYGPVSEKDKVSVVVLGFKGPIWAYHLVDHLTLLPAKGEDSPNIAFISFSCDSKASSHEVVQQKTTMEGALGRAIPSFLAEQIHILTSANGLMLVPVKDGDGSLVVSGTPWPLEMINQMAAGTGASLVFTGHIEEVNDQSWRLSMSLLSVEQKRILDEFTLTIDPHNPGPNALNLSARIREKLSSYCEGIPSGAPIDYRLPKGDAFNDFLSEGLAKSLALTVATSKESYRKSLYGERAILDRLLNLCLKDPHSDVSRIMFISALSKNKACGSQIFHEYQGKVEKLLKDYPLSGQAAEVTSRTLEKIYTDDSKNG